MRLSHAVSLLPLAAFVGALEVTSPTKGEDVDLSKSFTVKWSSVSTDPTSFDLYIVNNAVYPSVDQKIASNVDTSKGSYSVSGLSGLTNGGGYQINLLSDSTQNSGILAQSNQFTVEGSSSSSTFSTTASSTSSSSSTGTSTGTSSATTTSSGTTSSSSTGTTATSTGFSSTTTTGSSTSGVSTTVSGTNTLSTVVSSTHSASSTANASSGSSGNSTSTSAPASTGAAVALTAPLSAAAGLMMMLAFNL